MHEDEKLRPERGTDGRTSVESAGDAHHDHLEEEEGAEDARDGIVLAVDSTDADEMYTSADGDEDGGDDWLEEEEGLAHGGCPVRVKECDRYGAIRTTAVVPS